MLHDFYICTCNTCFPGDSMLKNPPVSAADAVSMPGLGRSPGEGHGNPFQHSCLGNPTDRGVWWVTAPEVTKDHTRLRD